MEQTAPIEALDTDTLLALLASLTDLKPPSTTILLDTLLQSGGDVEAAAKLINSRSSTTINSSSSLPAENKGKRKAQALDRWLTPSKATPNDHESDELNPRGSKKTKLSARSSLSVSGGSKSRPFVDLMQVLRQAPAQSSTPQRLPPLSLSTPDLVAQHTPCTLHTSVLPQELSCRLFYSMLAASKSWNRNKWWLFDRLVESPHRTSFYARRNDGFGDDESWQEAAQYWYNGRQTRSPERFPPAMEEACEIIERVVNQEMRKRKRFPLEWTTPGPGGDIWRANVAASNCYEGGKEGVGAHTDQLTYLGPYPTIASLSLGTRRTFALREIIPPDETDTRRARTFNIPLPHNSLIIMHASTQERFKHSIPPQSTIDLFRPAFPDAGVNGVEASNCRINITFRFYRPDFHPETTPRCRCGIPTVLRPDMKNKHDGETDRYWWTCYAAAQNEGKGCNVWKVMDMEKEGRGNRAVSSEAKTVPES